VLALIVSAAAHVLVLAALLVVRLPALQLPVTPPSGAAPHQTLFKVGVMPHVGGAAVPDVVAVLPSRVGNGTAGMGVPAVPPHADLAVAPSAPEDVAPAVDAPSGDAVGATTSDPVTPVGATGDNASGDTVAGGAVTGGAAMGGAATGGVATGGVATGGVTTGGAATGGAATGGVATGGVATGGVATGGEEVVALVHARLAAGAERCYPAAARRFQQRGTVEVRFCVDGQGAVQGAQVQRSSGADLLDAAVSACVLPQAAPFPESTRGRCFTVPVRFGLH
jgi:TonB family protein